MLNDEELKKVKDIVQSFLKAKKILRMYPENNPVYINTLEDNFGKFKDFFYYKEELRLQIRQNEVLYDSEQVYYSPEKDDNLALFFFKDGLREITFKKGLSYEEMEDFLKIISLDFSRDVLEDDVVTLFWEKDFQNIEYVVDEIMLADDEDYDSQNLAALEEQETGQDDLSRAYQDAFKEGADVGDISIVPLTDKDLQLLLKELEKDSLNKAGKLTDILFEMVYLCETREDLEDLVGFFGESLAFAIGRGDISDASALLLRVTEMLQDRKLTDEAKKYLQKVVTHAGSEAVVTLLGEVLDSGPEIEEKVIEEFVGLLDKNAIVPFMKVLGELKSMNARKTVIEALIHLGSRDIVTLAKGLNDSRWYVVRNIIYILRKIGDKRAVDYLLRTVRHGDIRVKKEVIRALGELGGAGVLQTLRECLDDPDGPVRSVALRALGNVRSEAAKRILLNKILDKNFNDRDFDEKKEYFEVLSRWKDDEIYGFLTGALKKKTFFRRAKNYENRACAAYCLGLMGNSDALPLLQKFRNDGNKMLKEFVYTAIKRIEYGQ
ncbi:MAG: HEAT repeat domain-containing protein [Candidatus Sulfobium sp.]